MMNETAWAALSSLKSGKPQASGVMRVLPLLDSTPRELRYLTLNRALASGTLRITEVSDSGSVPQLDADNRGNEPVLLFDGEEVAGAKQNRVFNTSILVPAKSKIRIPVSCTEQGRWRYRSRDFTPSGNVMAAKMRARKTAYVSASLESKKSYRGDQGAVWRDVDDLHVSVNSSSPTGAMSDSYAQRTADINKLAGSFKLVDGQVGMVVAVDDNLMGLDYVSSSEAFAEVFPKLIKSYALEGLTGRRYMRRKMSQPAEDTAASEANLMERLRRKSGQRPRERTKIDPDADLLEHVRNLLLDAEATTESLHPSVGMGKDYRYSSSDLVGSALLAEGETAHLALLDNQD